MRSCALVASRIKGYVSPSPSSSLFKKFSSKLPFLSSNNVKTIVVRMASWVPYLLSSSESCSIRSYRRLRTLACSQCITCDKSSLGSPHCGQFESHQYFCRKSCLPVGLYLPTCLVSHVRSAVDMCPHCTNGIPINTIEHLIVIILRRHNVFT